MFPSPRTSLLYQWRRGVAIWGWDIVLISVFSLMFLTHLQNIRIVWCFVMPPITPPAEICSHIEPHSAIRRSNQHPRQCDTVMLRWEMCCNIIICIKIWNHLWLTLIMFDSRIICGGQNTTPATSKSSSILMPATAAYHRHLSLFYTTINRLNKWITGIKCIN